MGVWTWRLSHGVSTHGRSLSVLSLLTDGHWLLHGRLRVLSGELGGLLMRRRLLPVLRAVRWRWRRLMLGRAALTLRIGTLIKAVAWSAVVPFRHGGLTAPQAWFLLRCTAHVSLRYLISTASIRNTLVDAGVQYFRHAQFAQAVWRCRHILQCHWLVGFEVPHVHFHVGAEAIGFGGIPTLVRVVYDGVADRVTLAPGTVGALRIAGCWDELRPGAFRRRELAPRAAPAASGCGACDGEYGWYRCAQPVGFVRHERQQYSPRCPLKLSHEQAGLAQSAGMAVGGGGGGGGRAPATSALRPLLRGAAAALAKEAAAGGGGIGGAATAPVVRT
jgi:hypothetical protein